MKTAERSSSLPNSSPSLEKLEKIRREIIIRFLLYQFIIYSIPSCVSVTYLAGGKNPESLILPILLYLPAVGISFLMLAKKLREYERSQNAISLSFQNNDNACWDIWRQFSSPPPLDMPRGEQFFHVLPISGEDDGIPLSFLPPLSLPSADHPAIKVMDGNDAVKSPAPFNLDHFSPTTVERLGLWGRIIAALSSENRRLAPTGDITRESIMKGFTKIFLSADSEGPRLTQEEFDTLLQLIINEALFEKAPAVQIAVLRLILSILNWYVRGPSPDERSRERFWENLSVAVRAERISGLRVDVPYPSKTGPWPTSDYIDNLGRLIAMLLLTRPTQDMREIDWERWANEFPYVFNKASLNPDQRERYQKILPYLLLTRGSERLRARISRYLEEVKMSIDEENKPTKVVIPSSKLSLVEILRRGIAVALSYPFLDKIEIEETFGEKPKVTAATEKETGRKITGEILYKTPFKWTLFLNEVWQSLLLSPDLLSVFILSDEEVLRKLNERSISLPSWAMKIGERLEDMRKALFSPSFTPLSLPSF